MGRGWTRILPGVGITLLVAVLGLVLPGPQPRPPAWAAQPAGDRVVFLAGGLSDEQLIVLSATLAASGNPGLLLLDPPRSATPTHLFLTAYRPGHVVPVGRFSRGAELQRRLGVPTAPVLEWEQGQPTAVWRALLPRAEQVVVCPAAPRRLLLQAACLAGTVGAPLYVLRGEPGEAEALRQQLTTWGTRKVFAAAEAEAPCRQLPGIQLVELADDRAVAAAHRRQLHVKGPIDTLVVANPADTQPGLGGMSTLAPWVALQRRGLLLLTNDKGSDATAVVEDAVTQTGVSRAENLVLVANLKAIPMQRRDNPVPGKDAYIEMEPLTPTEDEPFSFATGRLFHDDLSVVPLMLGRQRLLAERGNPLRALIVSNPGGSLPLLETFSRHTVLELRNHGHDLTALFGDDAEKEKVRELLPQVQLFMWEGHYRTMVDDFQLPKWDEPLQPSFIFMQSCLALNEAESLPLLARGAVGVAGSSTRNYSGSGGAFSLAFYAAILYDDCTVGAALRQAKNFLLAYALLKEKRLQETRLQGANLRSAWAFTLWGDPTIKLPNARKPVREPVQPEVRGNSIVLRLPEETYPPVNSGRYQAEMWPNTRLAGLVARDMNEESRKLVPLLFAEVALPRAPSGKTPRLQTSLPERSWVFNWDARRKTGYLLAIPSPRTRERREARFQVRWEP